MILSLYTCRSVVFTKWLVESDVFGGPKELRLGSGIVDVAGGKGMIRYIEPVKNVCLFISLFVMKKTKSTYHFQTN